MAFKVGDRVKAFGCEGVVQIVQIHPGRSVFVKFNGDDDNRVWFTADGRIDTWAAEPSLVLLEHPEQKIELTKAQVSNAFRRVRFEILKELGFEE